ncbi:ABC transporter permease [Flavitalea flava]
MLKNYFRTAWRNLTKNRIYSFLNIVGLAAGMAVALLIALWAFNEFSYDRFLPNYIQLYQVKVNFTSQHDGTHTQNAIALPLADILRKDIPGIKRVAESDWLGDEQHGLMVGNKKLFLKGGAAGSDFLTMFQFPLWKGNRSNLLKDPNSIVIDQSTAKAFFGENDPIDKIIRIDNSTNVKVTGVMKDIPANSSFRFSFLLPFSFDEQTQEWMKSARTTWTNNSFQIFVELEAGVSKTQIASKIKDLVYQHSSQMRPAKPEIILHPLKDWHLYSDFKNGKVAGGFIDYVRMFSIIGILVLLIACINFMNLSTARSEQRAKEVGVRKAVGSQRSDLIFQFLTESILIALLAFLLSLLLVQLVLPYFNTLTGNAILIPYSNPVFWCSMLGYVLITGLLAGSRPAFYLSSFNAVKVLKGGSRLGKSAALPRKILVVVQFSCSIALIISTLIVYRQIQYAKNRPTGYNADRLMMTSMSEDLNKNYEALKNELLQSGIVENITEASSPVTGVYSHFSLDNWPGKNAGEESVNIGTLFVSDSYFRTVGMKLQTGTDFSTNWSADTSSVILNEAAVNRIGLKNPIGREIVWNGSSTPVRIIGVVKDALMESPFTPVAPAIFSHVQWGRVMLYRLSPEAKTQEAIVKLTRLFDKYNPAYPYSYQFVDEEYRHKFNLEMLVGKLAGIFAGLAIFISCLGLFGLAAYVSEQRTKEIGIRKVLGASIPQIWMLLSGEFFLLVFISCLIASPVALYFLQNWLHKYDYRITIGPAVFVFSALIALLITLVTISFQAIKAALANPVRSLKTG